MSSLFQLCVGGLEPHNIARFTGELRRLLTEGGHSTDPTRPILVPVDDGAEGGPDSSPEQVIQEVEKQCRQWSGKPGVATLEQTDLIAHTSGTTTGNSKLVSLNVEALVASAQGTVDYLGGPGIWVIALPVHHIAGLQMLTRAILSHTEPVVAARPEGKFSLPEFAAATQLADQKRGPLRLYTSLVPRQLERLMASDEAIKVAQRYDAILVGGQATPAPLLQAAREAGLKIFTTYGSTETAAGCVYNSFPLPGVKLRLSPDGIVQIAGPQLMSGYLNARSPFVLDETGTRWLQTSDLGHFNEDGSLSVTGRADDLIIIGGLKIQPALVEEILRQHPLITDAAVVAIESETSPRLGALLAPSSSAPTPFPAEIWRQLQDQIATRLGHASVPKIVKTVPSLPLRGIGKLDRAAVRTLLAAPGGKLGAEPAKSEE